MLHGNIVYVQLCTIEVEKRPDLTSHAIRSRGVGAGDWTDTRSVVVITGMDD